MTWYYYIAAIAVASQLLFMYQVFRNFRYAQKKLHKKRPGPYPKTVLIIPCKGKDLNFEQNISSFFNLDFNDYLLWFVVEDKSDEAYDELCRLKAKFENTKKAKDVQIHVAGKINSQPCGQNYTCGQKIYNLLYCYHKIPADVEIMAFADSDICVPPVWLRHLVAPLRKAKRGVVTGYRWFVPEENNFATIALSAVNARVAQLIGDSFFNQAWGGSMAIKVETFRQTGLDKIWPNTLSDDLSLTVAVKKAKKSVIFAPACLVASHEKTSWREFLEFGRRQFLITRVCAPKTWWLGLSASFYSIAALWGTTAMGIYAASVKDTYFQYLLAVPVFFFICHFTRAILRQRMAFDILQSEREKMKTACLADLLFFWLWSLILFFLIVSSIFGRTITWRGIKYRLINSSKIEIIN